MATLRWPQETSRWRREDAVGHTSMELGEKGRAGEINVRLTRILTVPEAVRLDDITEGVRV